MTTFLCSYNVDTRADLKGLDSSLAKVAHVWNEPGYNGTYIWVNSDVSSKVSVDTDQLLYVAPTSDTTGASGAWMRQQSSFVVANKTALQSLDPMDSKAATIHNDTFRNGNYVWVDRNLSNEIAVDTIGMSYITADSDPTGSTGAWYKQPILSFRNRIINGACEVAQRGTGSFTGSPAFPVDRMRCYNDARTYTCMQNTPISPPLGFKYSTYYEFTDTASAVKVNDFNAIAQYLEGTYLSDFNFGKSNSRMFTLSFWVWCYAPGTYSLGFRNGAVNRSYVTTYTINAAQTWEYKTITITGDTTGTWATDNGIGLEIFWGLSIGSNYTTSTYNQWLDGNILGAANATQLCAQAGTRGFQITGLQLELGPVATPFEHRPFSQELELCQRYYEKTYAYADPPSTITNNGMMHHYVTFPSATATFHAAGNHLSYNTRKRATPTITAYSPITGASGKFRDFIANVDTTPVIAQNDCGAFWYMNGTTSSTLFQCGFHFVADSEF